MTRSPCYRPFGRSHFKQVMRPLLVTWEESGLPCPCGMDILNVVVDAILSPFRAMR